MPSTSMARHGYIERSVIERKILGRRAQDRDVPGVRAGLVLRAAQHRGLGLCHRE
jgi:hypothetical protein